MMVRWTWVIGLLLGLVNASVAQTDLDRMQGIWEITALIDDGTVMPEDMLRTRFALDGRFTIKDQSISFVKPSTNEKKTILFVINEKTSPKSLDLAGADKVAGKRIYVLSDNVLLLCLGTPESNSRPIDFSAKKGEPTILLTLKRVRGVPPPAAFPVAQSTPVIPPAPVIPPSPVIPPTPVIPPPPAPVPPPANWDATIRRNLIGTWGHQNDDWLVMFTVNEDGTFSSKRSFKKKFGKLFHGDVVSSGTWKLIDGVVICTITASTDAEQRQQIFSYRIRTISATEIIAVDQFGGLRHEWKTR